MQELQRLLSSALAGRYTVEHSIGEGAMGTVFRARDLRHQRPVAVKVLRADVGIALGEERFRQEILIAAQLDHPHILMLIDSGAHDDLYYYVMPFVDGESLRARMQREGRMPLGDALRITSQVADALDYAHRRGIVHRDVKPENILLSNGHAKLADFGIARAADAASRFTQTGMTIGTPEYMSPEQFLGQEIDGRSDTFALGCVLYEMLTGSTPLGGGSAQATMAKRLTQDVDRVSAHRDGIPPMVDMVVARALAREAAERHATTGEFGAALAAEMSGATSIATSIASTTATPRRAPLVGRDKEVDEGRALLDGLARGRGGILLIGGEPGVGKTRLSQTLLDEARARGAITLTGRCYEMEGMAPYTPYAELLDMVARVTPLRVFRDTLGDAAGEIARIAPMLRQTFPDLPAPLDLPPERQRQHLHAKYREFNERAARIAPIVVLMDDLHWADEASLALFEHSAGYIESLPIVVFGTYRDVDLEVQRGFAKTLESLTRQRRAVRISLRRLPRESVSQLLAALGGLNPPNGLIDVIHHETDGNPFFVEEVFSHLREEGRLFDANGRWLTNLRVEDLDVPEGVRLVIGRRLARLSDTTRAILGASAVAGPRFQLRVLEALGEWSDDELLDSLDAAVQAHLVAEQRGNRDVTYAFTHELIRQTLISSLSLPRRQRRHLKIADAIEKVYGDRSSARAGDLAYHLYQAGAAADPDRTIRYLAAAAEQSIDSAAFAEGLAQCERADSVDGASDAHVLARIALARALALRGLGQWSDALAAFPRAVDLAITAGDAGLIATAGTGAAWLMSWMGRAVDAAALASRTAALLPRDRTLDRARLIAQGGVNHGMLGQYAEAFALHREAIEAAESDPFAGAYANAWEAVTCWYTGRMDRSMELIDSALPLLTELATARQEVAETRAYRVTAVFYSGLWESLEDDLARTRLAAEEQGNIGALMIADCSESFVDASRRGDLESLERSMLSQVSRWESTGPWVYLLSAVGGYARALRGDPAGGLSICQTARDRFPRGIMWTGGIEGFELLCASLAGDRAWDDARQVSAPFLLPDDSRISIGIGLCNIVAVMAHRIRDDLDGLPAYRPLLDALLARGFRTGAGILTSIAAGVAAEADEDVNAAEAHYRDGLALGERIGNRFPAAMGAEWFARMLHRRNRTGDRERARAYILRACEEYRAMSMTGFLPRAEALRVEIS